MVGSSRTVVLSALAHIVDPAHNRNVESVLWTFTLASSQLSLRIKTILPQIGFSQQLRFTTMTLLKIAPSF